VQRAEGSPQRWRFVAYGMAPSNYFFVCDLSGRISGLCSTALRLGWERWHLALVRFGTPRWPDWFTMYSNLRTGTTICNILCLLHEKTNKGSIIYLCVGKSLMRTRNERRASKFGQLRATAPDELYILVDISQKTSQLGLELSCSQLPSLVTKHPP
jgi:hypothetical protein